MTLRRSQIRHKSWPLLDHLIRPLQGRLWDRQATLVAQLVNAKVS
jgi:hypothetical protein